MQALILTPSIVRICVFPLSRACDRQGVHNRLQPYDLTKRVQTPHFLRCSLINKKVNAHTPYLWEVFLASNLFVICLLSLSSTLHTCIAYGGTEDDGDESNLQHPVNSSINRACWCGYPFRLKNARYLGIAGISRSRETTLLRPIVAAWKRSKAEASNCPLQVRVREALSKSRIRTCDRCNKSLIFWWVISPQEKKK